MTRNGMICATVDCRNAYNAVFRPSMAAALYALPFMKPTWRLFGLLYNKPTSLHLQDPDHATTIMSRSGCRQGCTFSSILFCLALHPVLIAIAAQCPNVTIRAYMDDITIVGTSDDVIACIKLLRPALQKIGLELNHSKSFLYSASACIDNALKETGFKESFGGIKVLGAWIGEDATTLNFLTEIVRSHDGLFTNIPTLPADVAFPLLKACAIPVWNYAIRSHLPGVTLEPTRSFDAMSLSSFLSIARIHSPPTSAYHAPALAILRENQKRLLHLPGADGGLGLTRYEAIIEGAYSASRNPDGNSQSAATALVNEEIKRRVDASPEDAAHRLARTKRYTTAGYNRPSDGTDPVAYAYALQHAINYHPATSATLIKCPNSTCNFHCGPNELNHHVIGCTHGISDCPTATHTLVVNAHESLLREGNIPYIHEMKLVNPNFPSDKLRVDTMVNFADFDGYIDATIVSSGCKSHRTKAWAKLEEEKQKQKTAKYQKAIDANNTLNALIPGARVMRLITTTYDANGGFGNEASRFVKRVSEEGNLKKASCVLKIAQAIINGTGSTLARLRRFQSHSAQTTAPSTPVRSNTTTPFLKKNAGSLASSRRTTPTVDHTVESELQDIWAQTPTNAPASTRRTRSRASANNVASSCRSTPASSNQQFAGHEYNGEATTTTTAQSGANRE